MQTVLLTGFEPFDNDLVNPSWEAARELDGVQVSEGVQIVARCLPCAFATAGEYLAQLISELKPAMVIATGLAPGRSEISIERVAININDARIPDNLGQQPIDTAVVVDGPAAYFSTLPIKAIVKALRDAGFAAAVSQTAGTFVCNQVFYLLQHRLAGAGVRSGFIHVPSSPPAGQPSLVDGLRLGVSTAWLTQADVVETGGQVS
ncbi:MULTISPECIES: pyroglutamyl-peptidase I [Pseudomonas]|uniref:Pyrrolidone-carboxylate peptidase n=1 Tax=Pseudomonas haemolytica TaxID=2600065 RepID=A0A5P1D9A6_9PSED|nr:MULTISPECIES: pyroglutamyl-peptidase I [Pseudomonas]MBJ2245240.1 pyroglutamyl-peptidase I [Pseudomonas haemolytica]MBJ2272602.1 pyroglutamyl-peptidase I [Pseudomonas haemolytica]MBJ2286365.1 pyroglutamyl-peptidase I [Pseudomonas sp. MF6755]MBK3446912.1 pyroglutamyl-peptidase I [Pseudomonas haemolytica]MBK3458408.1 pyroglutamyl-peptidase I [Pseudomonas haemolytica]